LVQPKNLAQIKAILREQTDFEPAIVESIQHQQKNKQPFLFAEVDSAKLLGFGNYGMIDGIFPDLKALIPDWPGRFYLPIIFVRKPRNAKMKAYVAKKKILDHELEHLSYLLDYIDADPSYITRALESSLSASTPENIDRSVRFEIEKIFKQEAPILAKDYKKARTPSPSLKTEPYSKLPQPLPTNSSDFRWRNIYPACWKCI